MAKAKKKMEIDEYVGKTVMFIEETDNGDKEVVGVVTKVEDEDTLEIQTKSGAKFAAGPEDVTIVPDDYEPEVDDKDVPKEEEEKKKDSSDEEGEEEEKPKSKKPTSKPSGKKSESKPAGKPEPKPKPEPKLKPAPKPKKEKKVRDLTKTVHYAYAELIREGGGTRKEMKDELCKQFPNLSPGSIGVTMYETTSFILAAGFAEEKDGRLIPTKKFK
jgi:hypothetical protein